MGFPGSAATARFAKAARRDAKTTHRYGRVIWKRGNRIAKILVVSGAAMYFALPMASVAMIAGAGTYLFLHRHRKSGNRK